MSFTFYDLFVNDFPSPSCGSTDGSAWAINPQPFKSSALTQMTYQPVGIDPRIICDTGEWTSVPDFQLGSMPQLGHEPPYVPSLSAFSSMDQLSSLSEPCVDVTKLTQTSAEIPAISNTESMLTPYTSLPCPPPFTIEESQLIEEMLSLRAMWLGDGEDTEGDTGSEHSSEDLLSSPVLPSLSPRVQTRKYGRSYSWSATTATSSSEPTASSSDAESLVGPIRTPRARAKSFTPACSGTGKTPSRLIQVDELPLVANGDVQYPKPLGFACPVQGCDYFQTNRQKSELVRHIKCHFTEAEEAHRGARYVCCGVPVSEAARFGISLPDADACIGRSHGNPGSDGGAVLKMVGGCGQKFSRHDAYRRHLKVRRNREGSCRGDARGWWTPSWKA